MGNNISIMFYIISANQKGKNEAAAEALIRSCKSF